MDLYVRLLRYWKPYTNRLALAIGCMVVYGLLQSISVISLKPLIDDILVPGRETVTVTVPVVHWQIHGSPLSLLNILCLFLVTIFLARGIVGYGQTYFMIRAGQEASFDLRNDVFKHMMGLSLDYYDNRKTGDLISRMTNDMTIIQNAVSNALIDMVGKPLEIILYFGVLLYISWKLTLLSCIAIPLVAALVYYTGKKSRALMGLGQRAMSDVTVIIQEAVSNIRIIKAFSTEHYESVRFRRDSRRIFDTFMKLVRISVMAPYLMEAIGGLMIAYLLWVSGYFIVAEKTLTRGDMLVFLMALISSYRPVKAFITVNNLVQQGMAAVERVFEIMSTRPAVAEKPDARRDLDFTRAIEFTGVDFSYNDTPILRDISIHLPKGKTLAIVGPSGAGKTTLVSLLPRFYDVRGGAITIDGIDIRDVSIKTLRSIMGIVTQEVILFNDTVYNNIIYGLDRQPALAEVEVAATMANAHTFISALPRQYDTEIGDRGAKLSGGERQRLAIARAILRNPRILILDEATSALDTENEKLVQEALTNLMHGRTALVIAHRLSTITSADEIVVLDDDGSGAGATVIDRGTHRQLLERSVKYKKFYELQFQLSGSR